MPGSDLNTMSPPTPHRIVCSPDINLVDFAEQVWGVEKDIAILIQKHSWKLNAKELLVDENNKDQASFLKITKALLNSVHDFLNRSFNTQSNQGSEKQDKTAHELRPTTSVANTEGDSTISKSTRSEEDTSNDSQVAQGKCETAQKSKATGTMGVTEEDSRKGLGKRTRSEDDLDDHDHEKKRTKTDNKDDSSDVIKIDCSKLPWDCMACRSVYFIIGIQVQDFDVIVTYYDQFLEFQVAKFDIWNNMGDLALVLYGTHLVEAMRPGVDPHLLEWSPYLPEGSGDMLFYGTKPCGSLHSGCRCLHIPLGIIPRDRSAPPASKKLPSEAEEQVVGNMLSLFQIGSGNEILQQMFTVTELLSKPALRVGESTVVYKLAVLHIEGINHPDFDDIDFDVVLKLGWRPRDKLKEGHIHQVLAKKLPSDVIKNFPTALAVWYFTPEMLGLFWTKLDLKLNERLRKQMEQEMRLLMVRACKHWWEVDNEKELLTVWFHCVKLHHYAWKAGSVLHCDIDDKNIMFYRDANGAVVGVLTGWGNALFTDGQGFVIPTGGANSTATKRSPFMATDLLKATTTNDPVKHLYRHDLEAFFHVLGYAAIHYDLQKKTRKPPRLMIKRWFSDKISTSLRHRDLLFRDGVYALYLQSRTPQAFGLVRKILGRLYKLFRSKWKRDEWAILHGQELKCDFETYNGLMTYERFTGTVTVKNAWKPEGWEW
ncbi:hypothetical protein H1R20_g101, partial [Candolleomyces eurysporus]